MPQRNARRSQSPTFTEAVAVMDSFWQEARVRDASRIEELRRTLSARVVSSDAAVLAIPVIGDLELRPRPSANETR